MEETVKVKKVHSAKWHTAWRAVIGTLDAMLALTGLVFIVLGIISDYLPKKESENWTGNIAFEEATGMDYRWFGFILIASAVLIMVIFFNVVAKNNEHDREREERRKERMKVLADSKAEEPVVASQTVTVAEAKVSDIKKEDEAK